MAERKREFQEKPPTPTQAAEIYNPGSETQNQVAGPSRQAAEPRCTHPERQERPEILHSQTQDSSEKFRKAEKPTEAGVTLQAEICR